MSVDVINNACKSNSYVTNFTELLKFLPSLYEFWTEVIIHSHDSCLKEIDACEQNMIFF